MTVSTIPQEDIASDFGKRRPHCDKDYDNESNNNPGNINGSEVKNPRDNNSDDKNLHSSEYNDHHWEHSRASERSTMTLRSSRSSIDNGSYERDQNSRRIQNENDGEKNSPSRSTSQPDDEGEMHEDMLSDDDQLEDDEYDEGSPSSREGGNNAKNEDGSELRIITMAGERKPVKVRSMFVDKLYKMVEDPSIQHLISWAKEGDMFYVYNCIKLSDDVLPKFFKHNNWQSFVRQLNMYGFHKKESNLNRKNPETQRWQFYHPQFHRDQPHLRKGIKRKSARTTINAPSTARIIFEHEHGRGFFLQRDDRSRSNSGEGGHLSGVQGSARGYDGKLSPPKMSPGHQHQIAPSPYSNQPPTILIKAGPRPPSNGHSQREPDHRDFRDSRQNYPFPNQQDAHRPGLHQRQNTYPNSHYPIHSPDRPYDHNAPRSPTMGHDPHHPRPPLPSSPYLSGGPATPGYRSSRPNHPGHYPGSDNGPESPHPAGSAGHLRSQSVPGIDHRKASLQSRGSDHSSPHSYNQEGPQSPGFQAGNPNVFGGQQPHPTSPHLQRIHGAIAEVPAVEQSPRGHSSYPHPSYNDPHRPDRLPSMGGGDLVHKGSPQPSTPSLPSGSKLEAPPTPIAHPTQPLSSPAQMQQSYFPQANAHPTSPRQGEIVRVLENRIREMENAYAALQQHTQKLEQIQSSQDRTILWMRDRLDYMTDQFQSHRGPMSSPLVHSKRKAEPLPDDPRSRPRFDVPMPRHETAMGYDAENPDHRHNHGYGRNGPGPSRPGFAGSERHANGGFHEPTPAPAQPQHSHGHEPQHLPHPHHSMPPHMHQQPMQAQGQHGRPYHPQPPNGKPY
ncbi:hypothetical protein BGZ76_006143 [Entomortierella beljakovae]|nr:hypothetical protein BGZ76_006143 [Entomortierella beljakovae]